MKKCLFSLVFTAISFYSLVLPQSSFALDLFGYTFNDTAFSDDTKLISGSVGYHGFGKWGYPITGDDNIDLPVALNGSDLYTQVEGVFTADIYFKDNYLFNGSGNDLVVFEKGDAAESFSLSLYDYHINNWTVEHEFAPVFVGNLADPVDSSPAVNVAAIDFSYWGLSAGFQTNKIRIIANSNSRPPDIAAFGGLNSSPVVTPEPASMILFGVGGIAMALRRLRSKFNNS